MHIEVVNVLLVEVVTTFSSSWLSRPGDSRRMASCIDGAEAT